MAGEPTRLLQVWTASQLRSRSNAGILLCLGQRVAVVSGGGAESRPPPCDFRFLLSQFQLFRLPAPALAAETLTLERTLSDLVKQTYALTPAEIELMWKTAPPRTPMDPPAT